MAKGFSIDDVLGDQSKVTRPAGSRMDIVMLPIEDIVDNPENAIYEIGDVSGLKDNIENMACAHRWKSPRRVTSTCWWPDTGGTLLVWGCIMAEMPVLTGCPALLSTTIVGTKK